MRDYLTSSIFSNLSSLNKKIDYIKYSDDKYNDYKVITSKKY